MTCIDRDIPITSSYLRTSVGLNAVNGKYEEMNFVDAKIIMIEKTSRDRELLNQDIPRRKDSDD